MPLFRYQAVTAEGKKITKVIDADSYELAKARLLKEQVLLIDLALFDEKKKELKLSPALLLAFTRELSQLLRAGLPLYESLLIIEEKYRGSSAHPLFLDLCDLLKSGHSLSSSLKRYPRCFGEVYLALIESGEQTGSLSVVLEQLCLLLVKEQKLKKQVVSAATYPAFLGGFCLLILFALLFFIVPSMQELFEGRRLHPLTAIVLSTSRAITGHKLLFFTSLVFLPLSFAYACQRREAKIFFQKTAFKIPFLKRLFLSSSLSRFFRSASLLLSGGVPLIHALAFSRRSMNNPLLEEVMEKAEKKVVEGERFSSFLKTSPLIPTLVVRILSLAEETGKMTSMMASIAEIYEEDLEKDLSQFTNLLQPLLLLFLGGIVGIVILSILLPLTDVSSFL